MRVTGNMLSINLLSNLYGNLKELNKYQNQISANKRVLRLSDDPVSSVKSILIESDIRKTGQYGKNISDASSWLTQTETVLTEMNNVLVRASEIAVSAGNGTYSTEQRSAIKEELIQLRDHFLKLANTKYSGKYIFGGYNTEKPFDVKEGVLSYNTIPDLYTASDEAILAEKSQVVQYKVGTDTYFDVSINGIQLMGTGEDNIYGIFEGLINCIESPDVTDEMASYSMKFGKAQSRIISLISDVGGRQIALDFMTDRFENDNINLNDLYKKTVGIEPEKVITQYKMAETTYNAALQVGAQIIQRSLVDFLR